MKNPEVVEKLVNYEFEKKYNQDGTTLEKQ